MADENHERHPISEIRPHESEWHSLPENPERLTYRGRYTYLDRKLIELSGIENIRLDHPLHILDFGGGILPFGSPTAHDLVDEVEKTGNKAEIEVIDQDIPKDPNPSYAQVRYHRSLEAITGKFDIVRAIRVFEHLEREDLEKLSVRLAALVKEGGFYVTTPIINRYKSRGSGVEFPVPTFIRIMQKRDGNLTPIATLPVTNVYPPRQAIGDVAVPDPGYLSRYAIFRQEVMEGKAETDHGLDQEGMISALSLLGALHNPITALSQDSLSIDTDYYQGDLRRDIQDPSGELLSLLEKISTNSRQYFLKNN